MFSTVPLLLAIASILPGVLSQDCNSCQYNSTARVDNALCKCDAECQVYGDCCGANEPPSSYSAISRLPSLQAGVMLSCQSTYINQIIPVLAENEAYLMVSNCPNSWFDLEGGATANNCNYLLYPAISLPPVTDTMTGLVYKNELIACCNGVTQLAVWQTDLVCNPIVYELIASSNISYVLRNDPYIFHSQCIQCSFHTPIMTKAAPRSCIPSVSTCLSRSALELKTQTMLGDETYALMERKCVSGLLDLVRGNSSGLVYRNTACATCNAENGTECFRLAREHYLLPYQCLPGTQIQTATVPTDKKPTVEPCPTNQGYDCFVEGPTAGRASFSFTITLSNLGGGQVSISTIGDSTSLSLVCPKGQAPVGLDCQPTQCPEGYSETGGRCSFDKFPVPIPLSIHPIPNSISMNCSTGVLVLIETDYVDLGNDTIILEEDDSVVAVMNYDELGRPLVCARNASNNTYDQEITFLDCSTALVPLNKSDYTDLGNNSILFKKRVVEVMFYDGHRRPLVCPDIINSSTTTTIIVTIRLLAALPGIQELTYVGCSLSVLGTILILLTYTLFSELRTLPGLILMNLCITVLFTNFIFITGVPTIQSYPLKELCSSVAITLHFFYLTQFSWMSIFSCEMVRHFYQARHLKMDSNKTKHQLFAAYLGIGWCLPIVVSIISITLNFTVDGLILYGVDNKGQIARCWINHYESFIVAFLLPLVLCLSWNLLMFILITILLCRASKEQSKLEKSKSNTIILIRVWLAIFSITGLTWVFGFVAISDQLNWAWYLFVIFNSTQGLSIFLTFLFTKKILRLYLDLFTGKRMKKYELANLKKSRTNVTSISKISYGVESATPTVCSVMIEEREKSMASENVSKKGEEDAACKC